MKGMKGMKIMKGIKVKGTLIGEGMPKICVPVVGRSKNEVLAAARYIAGMHTADIVEWRIDMFKDAFATDLQDPACPGPTRLDWACLRETSAELRNILGEIPLLMTLRSKREGGEADIDADAYADICMRIASDGLADLLDVELFTGCGTGFSSDCMEAAGDVSCSFKATVEIISAAHEAGIRVIASSHDFKSTPDKDEIIRRLRIMQDTGADITKIAVMPQSARDVLTLLIASLEMKDKYADRPFVAISMGSLGAVSRISGEIFGSAITFGTAGAASQASAPGQISTAELKNILELLHQ